MLKILLVLALVILAVLALAAIRPARFTVQRSITIQAPPERVFPFLNDLHRWPEWSDTDPANAIQRSYSGQAAGKGAICDWAGAGNAGKGRMEIVDSSPAEVRLQVDWVRPFAARNFNTFMLAPEGQGTRVDWVLDSQNVFMLKIMTLFVSPDRLMGSHLEAGLASLKAAAEK